MIEALCPVCARANAADAKFCNACGTPLHARGMHGRLPIRAREGRATPPVLTEAVEPSCPDPFAPTRSDLYAPTQSEPLASTQASAVVADESGGNLFLTLRTVDPPPKAPSAAQDTNAAAGLVLIRSDPDPATDSKAPDPTRSSRAAKAARRALVRREMLASHPRPLSTGPEATDLLVFDRNEDSRRQLAELLEGFGFSVYAVRDLSQADAMLGTHRFAAVFLDIVLDGNLDSAPALLCRRAKQLPRGQSGRAPALLVITDKARSVDRVRASLAGADCVLQKPLARGEVVRALEDAGVALPQDPRHL